MTYILYIRVVLSRLNKLVSCPCVNLLDPTLLSRPWMLVASCELCKSAKTRNLFVNRARAMQTRRDVIYVCISHSIRDTKMTPWLRGSVYGKMQNDRPCAPSTSRNEFPVCWRCYSSCHETCESRCSTCEIRAPYKTGSS